jgi:hypothetical protein
VVDRAAGVEEQKTRGCLSSQGDCWTKPLRGRFKASIARAMQDGQKLIS